MNDTTRTVLIALSVALLVIILVPLLFMAVMMGAMTGDMGILVLLILVAGIALVAIGAGRRQ